MAEVIAYGGMRWRCFAFLLARGAARMQWRSGGLQLRDVCSRVSLLLLLLMLFVLLLVLSLVLLVTSLELIFFRLLARVVWGQQIVEQLSTRASRRQVSRTLILAVTS